jgi:hypothetical protein
MKDYLSEGEWRFWSRLQKKRGSLPIPGMENQFLGALGSSEFLGEGAVPRDSEELRGTPRNRVVL